MSEELKKLHVCVDRVGPLSAAVDKVAIAENPKNAPGEDPSANLKMALETRKIWKSGRTLRISFLDGSPIQRAGVTKHAKVWMKHANIRFEFVDAEDAEIRISFVADDGSWSAIGTDALVTEPGWFPPGTPTMNYGWLRDDTDDEEYSRVVVHEFGHALGCIHEHQNPSTSIKWNKPVVYRYFKETQGWSKEDVDFNIFDRYSVDQTQFTAFDRDSIMIYEIPPEFTLDGTSFPTNATLSKTDKEFIGKQYPKD